MVAQAIPHALDEYLELVDATGRIVKSGKRGAIPARMRTQSFALSLAVFCVS